MSSNKGGGMPGSPKAEADKSADRFKSFVKRGKDNKGAQGKGGKF